jgi:D-3-phosphoglycerate dehydrogenase
MKMAKNNPKLGYFNEWLEGQAVKIIDEYEDIDLVHLNFFTEQKINQCTLKNINGYQIMPRTELDPRYIANRELIDSMDNLLVICSTGAGYDMVDVTACTEAGIIVCNQSGTNKEAVSEHVFGIMLGLSKKMFQANKDMQSIDRLGRKNLI